MGKKFLHGWFLAVLMSSSMDQAAGGECSQIETFMELFDLLSKDLTKSITKLENKIAALGTCQGGLSTGVTGGLADDDEPYYADSFDGPTPPPPSPSASHLMVLTYEQPGEHLPYYSLQTVSTDPLQPVPSCWRKMTFDDLLCPKFDSTTAYPASTVLDGALTLCGTACDDHCQRTCAGTVTSDMCHKLNVQSEGGRGPTFVPAGRMARARDQGHSFASSPEWGLVIAGGGLLEESNISAEVEASFDGQTFRHYPSMPSGRWYHCLAVVDQDRLFVTGGYVVGGSSADTYIYSNRTATWTKVKDAPMSPESYRASCGSVRDPLTGEIEVVVAGGYGGEEGQVLEFGEKVARVMIYNVDNNQWRVGRDMPAPRDSAIALPYQNTLILVGGHVQTGWHPTSEDPTSEVWMYSSPMETFVRMGLEIDGLEIDVEHSDSRGCPGERCKGTTTLVAAAMTDAGAVFPPCD